MRNAAAPASTSHSGLCHSTRTTTKNRIVSIASVPGDRDAVGGGERGRGAEADHERDDRGEDRPVDRGHVDLPDLALGGVADRQPRQEPERDRLARDRERARR